MEASPKVVWSRSPVWVALTAMLAALVVAAPARAGFYDPPSPLPAGQPGDVIRAEPMRANVLPGVEIPAHAWRVLYRSQTATGAPVAVSGTVLVPDAPSKGPRPLVGYAIGSQGLADRCSPSQQLAAGSEYEAELVRRTLARGWALALTDYQGLGPPGEHPYVVGQALGRDVLDAMRAARRLPAAGLPAGGPLAVMGYSEGGGASGWAAELQPRYAPDLPLEGAAVGGVVADLEKIGPSVEGGPFAFLLTYTFSGYDAAYPELGLTRFLNVRGQLALARARGSCLAEGPAIEPFSRASDLATIPLLSYEPLLRRLRENRLGGSRPATPVLLQHARADNVLPYGQARTLADDWCRRGANVRFRDAPGVDHVTGAFGAIEPALAFLEARFAGERLPQPAACPLPASARGGAGGRRATVAVRVVRRRPLVLRVRPVGGAVRSVEIAVRGRGKRVLGRARVRSLARAKRVRVRMARRPVAGRRYRLAVRALRADGSRLRVTSRARMPRR